MEVIDWTKRFYDEYMSADDKTQAIRLYVGENPRFSGHDARKKAELANYLAGLTRGENSTKPSWMDEEEDADINDYFSEYTSGRGSPSSPTARPTANAPAPAAAKPTVAAGVVANANAKTPAAQTSAEKKAADDLRNQQQYGLSPIAAKQWSTSSVKPARLATDEFNAAAADPNSQLSQTLARHNAAAPARMADEQARKAAFYRDPVRLLAAGLITSDQMPSMGLSENWNKKTAENPEGTAEGDYFAQSRKAGFFSGADSISARKLDADMAQWARQQAEDESLRLAGEQYDREVEAMLAERDVASRAHRLNLAGGSTPNRAASTQASDGYVNEMGEWVPNLKNQYVEKNSGVPFGPSAAAYGGPRMGAGFAPSINPVKSLPSGFGNTGMPESVFDRVNAIGRERRLQNVTGNARNFQRTVPTTARGSVSGIIPNYNGTNFAGGTIPMPQMNPASPNAPTRHTFGVLSADQFDRTTGNLPPRTRDSRANRDSVNFIREMGEGLMPNGSRMLPEIYADQRAAGSFPKMSPTKDYYRLPRAR